MLPLMTGLFLLLAGAHLLGRLSVLLKQPALAGHMIAGILLGPSLLGWLTTNTSISAVSDIAVLFVVLTAGLEMRLQHVLDVFRGRGTVVMLIGFLVPAAAGLGVAVAFGLPPVPAIVVGICIAVTALPVALQILESFGLLHTPIGRVSIAGALLSDILVLMILGVIIGVAGSDHLRSINGSIALACAKLLGLVAILIAAQWLCKRLMRMRSTTGDGAGATGVSIANLSFVVLFVLGMGAVSELLGFHFAIGAFFAAMMIAPEVIGERSFDRLDDICKTLTASLFGPLFLACQGLQFQLQTLTHPSFVATLTLAAVVAKLLSGYVVGRLQRMDHHEACGVGIVMNARGVMELVIASIAFRAGVVDGEIFSALLAVGLVTTALTPLLLQRWQALRTPASSSPSARVR